MKKTISITLIFLLSISLINCGSDKMERNTKRSISHYIGYDSGLMLDTIFNVVTDSIYRFDSQDYTIFYTIEFDSILNQHIVRQIINSKYFNEYLETTDKDDFWKNIVKDSLKGCWIEIKNGYEYIDIPYDKDYIEHKSTVIEIKIDTLDNILKYEYHQM